MDVTRLNVPTARAVIGGLLALAMYACSDDSGVAPQPPVPGIGPTTAASTGATGGDEDEDEDASSSTSVVAGSSDGSETSAGVRYDVGTPGTTTGDCDPADVCCLAEGEYPPHQLLDVFLLAYPSANMPRGMAPVQAFEPVADEHMMAWSLANVGDELIDPDNGGVTPENIEAGRAVSRGEAELVVPVGATIVSTRDELVEIDPPNAGGGCIGTGWGWGSLLFEDAQGAFGELVYLYIGHCAGDGDVERFFYSDEAVLICESVG